MLIIGKKAQQRLIVEKKAQRRLIFGKKAQQRLIVEKKAQRRLIVGKKAQQRLIGGKKAQQRLIVGKYKLECFEFRFGIHFLFKGHVTVLYCRTPGIETVLMRQSRRTGGTVTSVVDG